MKQMKFFLVALMAVVMGMSVTSCMKGDDNTIYTGVAVAECVNSYPPTFTLGSQKLVINDATLLDLVLSKTYMFYYQFDTAEQSPDAPSITVTLYGGSTPTNIDAEYREGPEVASENNKANTALYSLGTSFFPSSALLSNNKLFVPFGYWVKIEEDATKQKEELNKHSFVLTYDFSNVVSGAKELVLTLNHIVNDAEGEEITRNKWTEGYKVYDLTQAIVAFEEKSHAKPVTIVIKVKVNPTIDGSLTGATDDKDDVKYTVE